MHATTPTKAPSTCVVGLKSGSTAGVNPKDKIGATKIDMTLIPVSAKIALAKALMNGARKYGEYNWRVEPVLMRTYLGAIYRHTDSCLESEDIDPDSLVEHLGHVMASAAIIIDAINNSQAVDDRPVNGKGGAAIRAANIWVKEQSNNE